MGVSDWKALAQAKREELRASLPSEWLLTSPPPPEQKNVMDVARTSGILNARELEITDNVDPHVLLDRIAKGEWSAVEVTTAYCKRAVVAQQVVNCLTEVFIDKAVAWAKDLDNHLAKTGKVVGPLHGLPISLKDQFSIEGLDTVMGYTSWIGQKADKNCALVDVLLEAGAVPFVRTNVPQTLMWPETYNHIFGRTVNPHNRTLTCGGSSGGEGALIAFKGSLLGVGTDIGGSVRIPAAACGIYSLRPSYQRIPYRRARNSLVGQEAIRSAPGPMAGRLASIKLFTKTIFDAQSWNIDPMVLRKPWEDALYNLVDHGNGTGLCFALVWDDGMYELLPPMKRALNMTRNALVSAGHRVIDWEYAKLHHASLALLAGQLYDAVGNQDFRRELDPTGEPLITTMDPSGNENKIEEAATTRDQPAGQPDDNALDAFELWKLHKRREELREVYLDCWNATKTETQTGRPVDALIMPCAPFPAPPHGKYQTAAGTSVWNVLDYPAVVVPVSTVDPVLDRAAPPHEFRSELDKQFYEMYSPEIFENAPVGLQVIARTLEDEAVISMAEILDNALRSAKSD